MKRFRPQNVQERILLLGNIADLGRRRVLTLATHHAQAAGETTGMHKGRPTSPRAEGSDGSGM